MWVMPTSSPSLMLSTLLAFISSFTLTASVTYACAYLFRSRPRDE